MSTNQTLPPRITQEYIDAKVVVEAYELEPDGRTTVCRITMANGWTERGYSACGDVADYDKADGERRARADAMRKIWPVEAYLLRELKFREELKA